MAFSVLDSNSRFEKSLGLLTTRFVNLLQEADGGILDLKVVSAAFVFNVIYMLIERTIDESIFNWHPFELLTCSNITCWQTASVYLLSIPDNLWLLMVQFLNF